MIFVGEVALRKLSWEWVRGLFAAGASANIELGMDLRAISREWVANIELGMDLRAISKLETT